VFGKCCSILALAFAVTAVAQVRLPIRITTASNALQLSDITYNGAIRMPVGLDTFSAIGSMTGRQVSGDTHLFIYLSAGGVDYASIAELDVTGLTPNTTIASAPRATLITNWGDDYGSCRRSWEDDLDEQDMIGFDSAYSRGLHWRSTNSMLYVAYSVNYTDIAKWSLLGITLDDDSPVTTTCYGPWRISYDSTSRGEDGTRTHTLMSHPTTGKMLGTGGSKSGHTAIPWGPSLIGGNDWPTTATTGGIGMTPIEAPDTYLNYYYPEPPQQASSTYSVIGAPLQTIKQFRFPSNVTYVWETYTNQPLRVDPLLNGGIGTWSSESSSTGQGIWFNGTNKKGVIFPASIQGAYGNDPNSANGYVKLGSVTGSPSGTMTGGTSGDVANVFSVNGAYAFFNDAEGDEFLIGETVTGTGWSATVLEWDEFDTCNHGCVNAAATGPVSTKYIASFIVYDPAELERVKAGTIQDYQAEAEFVADVTEEFNLTTGGTNGKPLYFDGAYLNGTTLYMISHQADISSTGNPNAMEALIHVFTLDDSAPPAPVGYVPVEVLSLAAGVWALGRLRGRRHA
jgi:hypothetical protein